MFSPLPVAIVMTVPVVQTGHSVTGSRVDVAVGVAVKGGVGDHKIKVGVGVAGVGVTVGVLVACGVSVAVGQKAAVCVQDAAFVAATIVYTTPGTAVDATLNGAHAESKNISNKSGVNIMFFFILPPEKASKRLILKTE